MAEAEPMCISYSVMDSGKETLRLLRALEVTAKRAESESSGCAVAVPPEGTVARTEQALMWSQARMKISTATTSKRGETSASENRPLHLLQPCVVPLGTPSACSQEALPFGLTISRLPCFYAES